MNSTMKKRYNKSARDLFCYGCAWGQGDIGFPGRPGAPSNIFSPCSFCLRNPEVQERVKYGEPLDVTEWPDGLPPVNGLPCDCYITADMIDQTESWLERAVEEATRTQLRRDVAAIAREYGYELPEHEVG